MNGSAASFFERSHRDEVVIANRPNVGRPQCEKRLSSPRRGHEFHLECFGCVHFDNRAKVAAAKPGRKDIVSECDGV